MLGAVTLVFTANPILSTSASVRAAVRSGHTKTVKPDFAYYAGKTINVIWSNSSGTANNWIYAFPDVEARLHATINITYVPAGGGVAGLDAAMDAPPDGLTIGGNALSVEISQLIFNQQDPYNFSVGALQYIVADKGDPSFITACPNSGTVFSSMKQLIADRTPIKGLATAGGTNDLALAMFAGAYQIPLTILTAFNGGAATAAGCEQGDGQIAGLSGSVVTTAAGNAFAPGIEPLIESGEQPKGGDLNYANKEIPDYATFFKDNPPKTKAGKAAIAALIALSAPTNPFLFLAAPRNTPPQYVLALRDAFTSAMAQANVKAEYLSNNTLPGAFPGNKLAAYVKDQLKAEPTFRKYVTPNP